MKILKLIEIIVAIFLTIFILYPLITLFKGAFLIDGKPSLELFKLLFSDHYRLRSLLLSLNLASLVVILSTIIALPLGCIATFYHFSAKKVLTTILLAPLILPPFVGAIGIRQILGRFGSINLILLDLNVIRYPIEFFPSDSLTGIALLQTLHLFPLMFLAVCSALNSLDYAQIEVGRTLQASVYTIFRRITLPLLSPALISAALLIFISSLTDLGTPLMFDYRQLLPVQIYQLITESRDTPLSLALCICLSIICATIYICLYLNKPAQITNNTKNKIPLPQTKLTGAINWIVVVLFITVITISLLPHLGNVLLSFSKQWFMTPLPSAYTFNHYLEVLTHPLTRSSFTISAILTLLTIVATSFFGIIITYLHQRKPGVLSYSIDLTLILPLVLPGILFAFSYLNVFTNTILDPRYFPLPLLLCGYIARRLPLTSHTLKSAIMSVSTAMEESAWSVGASRLGTIRSIVLPQIKGAIFGANVLTAIVCMIEISESMFICLDEKYYPISKALYALTGRPDGLPLAAAFSTIVILVILLMLFTATLFAKQQIHEILVRNNG
jgi:iron(III) transport system permease protein